jgi:threonine dehydrogenase-like Zn-dependent dehydrogenase
MSLAGPGTIVAEERPRPEPAAGELLLRTEACGLCASELDVFLGRNPWQQYPALLGHEVVGRVAALGGDVDGWNEGDLVAAAIAGGGYAEYLCVGAAAALPVPAGMPPDTALAEPIACAVNSLEAIAPRPDDRVVVLGAGFMALLLVQLLRGAAPCWQAVAARRPDARELALRLGATDACETRAVQGWVWDRTGGEGADIVVEATGSEEMLAIAASLLRPEGTLAIVGYHPGDGRRVPVHEWNWKALRIANCHFRSQARTVDAARRGLALAARGQLDVARLLTHRFPLSRLQEAFETAAARQPGFVKAVVVPDAVDPVDAAAPTIARVALVGTQSAGLGAV